MLRYCEFDTCFSEQHNDETVCVSESIDIVKRRRVCYPCSEVFGCGVQHGRFRAMRQLRAYAESLREQGFVTEAGVIFAALPKLDTATDPGEEGVEVPTLDDDEEE